MKKILLTILLLLLSSCYATKRYYYMDEWEPYDDSAQYEKQEIGE